MHRAADEPAGEALRRQAHPGCCVCAPERVGGLQLCFRTDADGSVSAGFDCSDQYEGYPGIIHGGVVAALLDGAMANCLFAHGHVALTGDLRIRYRTPLRVGTMAAVRAWITRSSPPLFALEAEVLQAGSRVASATARFMRPEQLP